MGDCFHWMQANQRQYRKLDMNRTKADEEKLTAGLRELYRSPVEQFDANLQQFQQYWYVNRIGYVRGNVAIILCLCMWTGSLNALRTLNTSSARG